MALVNIPDIQNLDPATPESINSRVGALVDEVNGNLDSTNLATGGVNAANLASSSVSTTKVVDAAITPPKWTNPYKFRATRTSAWTSGNSVYALSNYDTVIFDTSSNYNNVTGIFTAPVAGFYHFDWGVYAGVTSGGLYVSVLAKNGPATTTANIVIQGSQNYSSSSNIQGSVGGGTIQLAANDYVSVWFYGNGGSGSTDGSTSFSGFLVSQT